MIRGDARAHALVRDLPADIIRQAGHNFTADKILRAFPVADLDHAHGQLKAFGRNRVAGCRRLDEGQGVSQLRCCRTVHVAPGVGVGLQLPNR